MNCTDVFDGPQPYYEETVEEEEEPEQEPGVEQQFDDGANGAKENQAGAFRTGHEEEASEPEEGLDRMPWHGDSEGLRQAAAQ